MDDPDEETDSDVSGGAADAEDSSPTLAAEPTDDPRTLLTKWSNKRDEWIRYVVRLVIGSGRRLSEEDIATAYQLFLEEKQLEERELPAEPALVVKAEVDGAEEPLLITRVSDVHGVNALVPGSTIDLNPGLTILFGENGTGKTGYARVLKLIANSRTADEILPDINDPSSPQTPSATIEYELAAASVTKKWAGERGVPPFTRMAIFDTPAVTFHVDENLTYVYTPASLALFEHVTHAIRGVQALLDRSISALKSPATQLLERFDQGSSVYPMIETLGAATDLGKLKELSAVSEDAPTTIKNLRLAVAALQADTLPQQISTQQRRERVLAEAGRFLGSVAAFPDADYAELVNRLAGLRKDYSTFRENLFASADLPAPPDDAWEAFVRSGQTYREHLEELDVHDQARCLYCRQALSPDAADLLTKYRSYLEDRIAGDIADADSQLAALASAVLGFPLSDVEAFVAEQDAESESPEEAALRLVTEAGADLRTKLQNKTAPPDESLASLRSAQPDLQAAEKSTTEFLVDLRAQHANQGAALASKQAELRELEARVELGKSWVEISRRVQDAQRADKLKTLAAKFAATLRQVTELSKTASHQLINQDFGQLFAEECAALRAPQLKLEFVGRDGKPQRRKVLGGNHLPSKVLSEGEQKVLALADFLAEARLTGISAPIVFDDPVSSLDHRRIKEVADRVATLAQASQVIVFTHDILFATNLLARFEKSKRCSYFQVTDEDGKGKVDRATGPRWDTLASLKKHVNETIQAAKAESGEARAALVRTGYDWIRSWCEVFVESELLVEVTQRYQPNVKMTALARIKVHALSDAIETVTTVFEDACRYIDGHSQPLATLGVAPTLANLENDWATLQACQKKHRDA